MKLRPALLIPLALSATVAGVTVVQLGHLDRAGQEGPGSADRSAEPVLRQQAIVARHVDGDTLWLTPRGSGPLPNRTAVKVRLIGIDAPETRAPGRPPACHGAEASRRLLALLPRGATVAIEVDRELRDGYGRYLVYLWRGDPGQHAQLVNEILLREGYARLVGRTINTRYADRLRAAEHEARTARRGLWGACR